MPLRRAGLRRIDNSGASPLKLRPLDGVLAQRDRPRVRVGGGPRVPAAAQEGGGRGGRRGGGGGGRGGGGRGPGGPARAGSQAGEAGTRPVREADRDRAVELD